MTRRVLFVLLAFVPLAARAQSSAEVNSKLQFNFTSPGARSLGVGGAFIGLADDATAAYTNPAGLVNLATPELSVEGRAWKFRSEFPLRGHAFDTPPTNKGEDRLAGVSDGHTHSNVNGLSFGSFAYPGERWSFALYRHRIADFKASSRTEGVFFTRGGLRRFPPTENTLRLQIASYGAAAAFRLTENFDVGASVGRYEFGMHSETLRYEPDTLTAPATYDLLQTTLLQHGADHRWAFNAGALWQATDAVAVGAVYHSASSFRMTVSTETAGNAPVTCNARFNVPDVFGIGVSIRSFPTVTIAADYDRVRYSKLTRNYVEFSEGTCGPAAPGTYVARDGGEIHAGVAKVIFLQGGRWRPRGLIVSAGWWYDPPHAVEYADQTNPQSVLFPPGRSDNHFSAGLGIDGNDQTRFYLAYEISRRDRGLSASALVRFR